MAWDKKKSIYKQNPQRIPEGVMFFLVAIFGGVGVYLGMFWFHHKTRKLYFQIGIPLFILQNFATIYLLFFYSSSIS